MQAAGMLEVSIGLCVHVVRENKPRITALQIYRYLY